MFQETCSLVLKHSDISTDTTLATVFNSIGSWSNGKQSTTWRINLKKLLGPAMYDNNDMFVLRLNQIANASAGFPKKQRSAANCSRIWAKFYKFDI